jgi:hypothetical protein
MKAKKPPPPPPPELKKGMLLVLKVAPFFNKPYLYEVISAGDKLIRASLYHSPTVRKSWSIDEFMALLNNNIVRIATEQDVKELAPAGTSAPVAVVDDQDDELQ